MTKGKTLAEFRATHNRNEVINQRIRSALAELGDSWEYEMDFARRAKIASHEWSPRRELYATHIVFVKANFGQGTNSNRRRIIAGTAKFAAKLRAAVE